MNKIKKYLKNKKGLLIFIAFASFALFPVFINTFFMHPVADDYSQMNLFNNFLGNKEINIITFFETALRVTKYFYTSWQGTFFSIFLGNFNPMHISVLFYRITMLFLQFFYIFSVIFFFSSFTKTNRIINFKQSLIISLVYIIFSIAFMYSPAEGLYWFSGVLIYLLPFSISIIFFGLLIRYFVNRSNVNYILLFLLALCIGGTSYVTGLVVNLLLFIITIVIFCSEYKKDLFFKLLFILIFSVVSFAFNVFCPGNFIRIYGYNDVSALKALIMTIPVSFDMICKLLFQTIFIPLIIIFIPFIVKVVERIKYKFKWPILLPTALILIFMISFAPCTYSYGSYYQETRVQNIQFFYLILFALISIINLIGYLVQNKVFDFSVKQYKYNYYIFGSMLSIMMVASIGFNSLKTKLIFDDIFYQRSPAYNECMKEIYTVLSNNDSDKVVIKSCSSYPESLHHYIFKDEDSWIIDEMEAYFEKEITVKNP